MALDKIPARLAVVGGGVIGCEYACMFQTLGTVVTVIEKRDRILGSVDHEISHALQTQMESQGTRFHLGTGVSRVEDNGCIRLFLDSGEVVEADAVVKGQTASSSYKPAVVEGGIRVMVPPHIAVGTRLVINTEDGSYMERAKD